MSDLRPKIRAALNTFLDAHEGYHLRADVLRIIEEEALLLKQTQLVKDEFSKDPMQQFGEIQSHIERLQQLLRVTSFDRIRALDGYVRIDAVVTLGDSAPPNLLQLTFRFEQKRRQRGEPGCHIRYSIELSKNYLQRENLIVVEVWAPKDGPSPGPAVCINQQMENAEKENDHDDEDGWSDIDEDENNGNPMDAEPTKEMTKATHADDTNTSKRQKLNEESQQSRNDKSDEKSQEQQTHDEYLAYLDPDVMHEFLVCAGLHKPPMDDGKAFFLLMTFPFYEHEFDLVGYLLDEIFGSEDSDDDDDDDDDDET